MKNYEILAKKIDFILHNMACAKYEPKCTWTIPDHATSNNTLTPSVDTEYYYNSNASLPCTFRCNEGYEYNNNGSCVPIQCENICWEEEYTCNMWYTLIDSKDANDKSFSYSRKCQKGWDVKECTNYLTCPYGSHAVLDDGKFTCKWSLARFCVELDVPNENQNSYRWTHKFEKCFWEERTPSPWDEKILYNDQRTDLHYFNYRSYYFDIIYKNRNPNISSYSAKVYTPDNINKINWETCTPNYTVFKTFFNNDGAWAVYRNESWEIMQDFKEDAWIYLKFDESSITNPCLSSTSCKTYCFESSELCEHSLWNYSNGSKCIGYDVNQFCIGHI